MAKSKALSPDVQGLLEKVRLQAQQYSDAFEYFEKKKTEFDRLLNDLELRNSEFSKFLSQLKSEILKIKNDFNTTTESNLLKINEEIKKYTDFNDNYQNLKEFINELKHFQKEITETVSHYENNLETFKSDLSFGVDNSINTLRKSINEEIEKKINIVEKNISTRFAIADKMIADIKNQIIQNEKGINNEINILKNLLEKSKTENIDFTSSLQNNLKKAQKRTDSIEKQIKKELYNTNKRISDTLSIVKFIKDAGNMTEGSVDYDFALILAKYFQPKNKIEEQFNEISSDFENKVSIINENLEDLKNRFQKNKNMMIAFLSFGFFFIIAIIVIIISSVL